MRKLFVFLVIGSMLFAGNVPARALDGEWSVNSNGNWSDGGRWSGGTIASGAGFAADFSNVELTANRLVTLDAPYTIGQLVFGDTTPSDHGWTLSGSETLTLDNSGPAPTINVNDLGSGYVSISTVLAGGEGLTKAGTGTLLLYGLNNYTGVTTLGAGILQAENSSALGAVGVGNGIVVSDGAVLRLNGGITIGNKPLTLAGTGIANSGALVNYLDNANEMQGDITLAGASRINSAGTLTLSGDVSGGEVLTVGGTGDTIISGIITTGANTLTKDGTGTLTLSGANTYSGGTAINAGVVSATTSAEALGTGAVTVADGAALQVTGNLNFNEALSLSGTGVGDGGALRHISGTTQWSGGITLVEASRINSDADTLTISGGITGNTFGLTIGGDGDTFIDTGAIATTSGTLTKEGSGTLYLGGMANTYTGLTNINSGTVSIQHANSLGTTDNGTVVADGTTLMLSSAGQVAVAEEALTISGTGVGGVGALHNSSGDDNSYAGDITLAAAATISNDSNSTFTLTGAVDTGGHILTVEDNNAGAAATTYSGVISGDGGLTKTGTETVILSGGVANTFTGTTTVSAGTLVLDKGADGTTAVAGNVTIDGGTLRWDEDNQVADASTITMTSGAMDLNDMDETITSFSNSGGTFTTGSGHLVGTGATITWSGGINTVNADGVVEDSHIVISGGTNTVEGQGAGITGGILQLNAGGTGLEMSNGSTLTLDSDVNDAGKLLLKGNVSSSGAAMVTIASSGVAANAGTVDLDGDTRTFTIADGAAATDMEIGAVVTNGGIAKAGDGTLLLSGVNTYTGATTVNAGTLQAGIVDQAFGVGSAVTMADAASAILDLNDLNQTIGSLAGGGATGGNVTLGSGTLTVGDATSTTYAGVISETGSIVKEGAGTLILSGANSYTGATTINTGTLQADHANALGTGAGGVTNNATLAIGTTDLDISAGAYIQTGTLLFTANSTTDYGTITSTNGNVAGTITPTIAGYIPNGTVLNIIDGSGILTYDAATTITDYGKYTFTGSESGGILALTASRAANGFASNAVDGNAKAIGEALDDVANPTADMTTILDTLDGLSAADVDSSLQSMEPSVDAGIIGASNLNVGNMLQSISNHFSLSRGAATSGIATGDVGDIKTKDIWAKAFGTYAKQDKRKGIEGYRADVIGGALGVDFVANEKATLGISAGYAYNKIKPKKASLGNTEADSMQGSLYYSYNNEVDYLGAKAMYFDLIGSFAYNMYEGKRNVTVGAINRTAKAEYDSQQYTVYGEAGYHIPADTIDFIPLASLQYTRSNFEGYTEKGADALNLKVDKQHYDLLEMGLGLKIASIIRNEDFDIIPSVRGKWLYDFIADKAETTSRFTGGGASFKTEGAKPAKSSFDIGTTLTFLGKNNVQIDLDYDFNIRQDFQSHNGAVTLKYKF
jgi:autotransporter-associated beta strand protein